MFSQRERGLCSVKGYKWLVVQPRGRVGAYMWMLDGWELYVCGKFSCEV